MTYPAPDPMTRLSEADRKLLGLPADPTKPRRRRTIQTKADVWAMIMTCLLTVGLALWAAHIALDLDAPAEGPTNTIYDPATGYIIDESTGLVLEETR